MAITVTVEADYSPPRIRIDTDQASVWRVQGGRTTLVRGGVVAGTAYDYECPQETPVTFTDGVSTSPLVALPDCGDWLVHLSAPERSQQLVIREHPEWTKPAIRDVIDIPASTASGEGRTIAVSFGRNAARGDLTLNTYTPDDEAGMQALLADGSLLFLSTPEETGIGPCYVSLGDARWARRMNYTGDKGRIVALPYVEVERPEMVVETSLTWSQLASSWPSLASAWSALERS